MMSTIFYFYPHTNGQSERTIQILEDMLRACVLDHRGSWEEHLPLVEFAYNNSYQVSIQIGTLRGFVREAMPITDLLDRGGGELHHWSDCD